MYTKPPLDFNKQAKLLIRRGLIADQNELEEFLSNVNYYRFTGYLYPFRDKGTDSFIPGTAFQFIKDIYQFDMELRLFTLSCIEIIEVSILRTKMVEMFTLACGPFCYTQHVNFDPNLSAELHQDMLRKIEDNINNSKEEFINSYRSKYYREQYLPFWMVAEASTFGLLSTIFNYLPLNVKTPIAKHFNLHSTNLSSWLHTLSNIRNICAHHSRLWNRRLPIKPTIPVEKYHPEFYSPAKVHNDSYFIILGILNYLLERIDPAKAPINSFVDLVRKYPNIPLNKMGFPRNWQDYKLMGFK
ncbi:MAG: Abi family protein [Anaerolineae bacterium]|nr:Abi family protein [Chloroflexota bacterium]NPV41971.1 Abi family protein [Anaerolineae bacterium]